MSSSARLTPVRTLAAILTVLLALLGAQVATPATAGPGTSTPKAGNSSGHKGTGSLTVRIRGKAPAQVTLVGPQTVSVLKSKSNKTYATTMKLAPGRYRVKVPDSLYKTRVYRAQHTPKFVVVHKGGKGVLEVRLKGAKSGGALTAQSATSSSITLALRHPKDSTPTVRMAPGGAAPKKPGKGVAVPVKHGSATASGLVPGQTYAFALFGRQGHRSVRLATTTASVSAGGAAASYALAPGSTLVSAADTHVTYIAGELWWDPQGPTPMIGSGVGFADSPAVPFGFVGFVAEISADGRLARVQAGGLGDVFSFYDVSSDLGGAPTIPVARRARQVGDGPGRQPSRSNDCPHVSAAAKVVINPQFTPGGYAHVGIRSKWGIPYQADFDIKASLTVGATMDVSFEAALECGIALPKVYVQLAAAPVPIMLKFEPRANVAAQGKLEFKNVGLSVTGGFWVKGSVGASNHVDGGLIKSVQPSQVNVIASGGLTLTLGGSLSIGPGAGNSAAGAMVGVSGTYNPLKASLTAVFPLSDSRHDHCVKLDVGYEAGLAVKAEAWIGHFSAEASATLNALNKEASYLDHALYYPDNCEELPNLQGGALQATLSWGSTADLDLHVTDPNDEEIYFGQPTSDSGGALDIDANAGCEEPTTHPVENIYWPQGEAPSGTYYVQVQTYDACQQTNLFWRLQVRLNGQVVLDRTGNGTSDVFAVNKP
jgi:hypothetical protein